MIGNGVHNGGVVDVLLEGCECTALTATMVLFVAEPAGDVVAAGLVAVLALAVSPLPLEMFVLSPVVHVAFVAEVPVAEAGSLVGVLALASLPVVLRWGAGWVPTRVLGGRWRSTSLNVGAVGGLGVSVVDVPVWVCATVPGPGIRVLGAWGGGRLELLQNSFLALHNA